jgi:putative ABC transport system substrate-binding protein
MKRREFVTLLGGAAAAWPLATRAQQAGKLPTIGFLGADASAFSPWTAAFVARLGELGWIEGKTIAIEYRWSQGRSERYAEIAAEFVRLKVDAIVTVGSAVPIVRQATAVIPIVFAVGTDPVGSGLVASLAQPGGNVTGLSIQANELAGKRLEFAQELIPQLHRLAIMFNVGNAQAVLEMGETQAAARMLGLEVTPLVIQRAEDIAPAFQTLKTRADALYVVVDQLIVANRTSILTSALGAQLPTIFSTREFVKAGALMSYGPSLTERFGRAADYVDKILHGAKPGDLPVEQPTKFELVINLTTAKALGLNVPHSLLARADEVIE